MAVIYLKHPVHGAKVAISDFEADYDEKFGWERYNPDTPSAPVEEAVPINALEVKRRSRRSASVDEAAVA